MFIYRNRSGFVDAGCSVAPQGIKRVVIKDRRATKGDVLFVVRGVSFDYLPGELPPRRVQLNLALGAQGPGGEASAAAQAGDCLEIAWEEEISAPPCRAPFKPASSISRPA